MSRNLHIVRDEAEVYAALERIKDGRKVTVSFVQHPLSTVCVMVGRWVGQDLPARMGWMVVAHGGGRAIIMPTDKVTVFKKGGSTTLRVDLTGRRIARSAAMVRRARIAGILPKPLEDEPAAGGVE